MGSGYPDISWHGTEPWKPDWTPSSRTIAFMLCGRHGAAAGGLPHFIYCVFNMYHQPLAFTPPVLPKGMTWSRFVDTAQPSPDDICEPGEERSLDGTEELLVKDRSAIVLLGK